MENIQAHRLLSIGEMADFLGVKVNTLYSWVHIRKIPYIKVGRLVKFDLQEVKDWLKNFKVEPWKL